MMLTSILAVYTVYSDKTSCTTDSLTKIITEPLPLTCTPNYGSGGYYKDICSNGELQVVQYTNANCTTISSTTPRPTGCQNGMKTTCNATPAPPSQRPTSKLIPSQRPTSKLIPSQSPTSKLIPSQSPTKKSPTKP